MNEKKFFGPFVKNNDSKRINCDIFWHILTLHVFADEINGQATF